MGHKRIGAPTTRTPIPSPAHQCTAATGHEAPLDTALTPLPISPPTSGPASARRGDELGEICADPKVRRPVAPSQYQRRPDDGLHRVGQRESRRRRYSDAVVQIDCHLRDDYRKDDDRPPRSRRQQHRRHRHARRREERRTHPGAERLPRQHRAHQVRQRHAGEQPARRPPTHATAWAQAATRPARGDRVPGHVREAIDNVLVAARVLQTDRQTRVVLRQPGRARHARGDPT